MKPRYGVPVVLLLLALLSMTLRVPEPQQVSLILYNGIIHTVNPVQPRAEALAVRDDRIVAVGSTAAIRRDYTSSVSIDLAGRTVVPGFIDAHAHLEGMGASLMSLDLTGAVSVEEIRHRVAERVPQLDKGVWLRGRGWDQNLWAEKSFPTHAMLDAVAPDIPVYLTRIDGHAVWVNGKVLALAGITRDTPDPDGGRIYRDAQGDPTGVFVDNAVGMLDAVLPDPTIEERKAAILLAVHECLKRGLTEVHDMGVDLEGIRIYKELIGEGKFPFRVYVAVDGVDSAWFHYLSTGPETTGYEDRLVVRAIKMYADGALGSRGAALIEPYSDDPGNRGLTLTSANELTQVAGEALEHGFQVCTHAIGDRANHIVLNSYENAFKSFHVNGLDRRFRVEHAQVVAPDDLPRFAELGVVPSMQPTHCTSDMPWAEQRLGPKRVLGAYAWHTLLEHGSIIPGGSDFPVERPDPLWGIYAAVTRQDHSGNPPGGWYPDQRMTREEALRSFTIWGAYAAFQENIKGSIEKGKLADFVILTRDIMAVDPQDILSTEVDATFVAGKMVYPSVRVSR